LHRRFLAEPEVECHDSRSRPQLYGEVFFAVNPRSVAARVSRIEKSMHATELPRKLPENWPGVIALVGDERALKMSTIVVILKNVLPGEDDSPSRFAGKDTEMKTVRDELRTVSMWSDCRVAIVDDADEFVSENRPALEKYATSPAKKSLLILDVKSMPKNTRLYKAIQKTGLVVECTELKGASLSRWIQESAESQYEKKIGKEAVQLLTELVGGNLGLLGQELSKLASYVGDLPKIDVEAVRRLVGGWKAETTWAMTDAVRDGRLGEALSHLDKLLGSGESPFRIVGGVSYVFRKLATATELSRGGVPLNAALRKAGVFPNDTDGAANYLRRIGRPKAEQISNWLLETDAALKGGSRISERTQVEMLLVKLSGA
jgi:DNA polymerase III subunit delta